MHLRSPHPNGLCLVLQKVRRSAPHAPLGRASPRGPAAPPQRPGHRRPSKACTRPPCATEPCTAAPQASSARGSAVAVAAARKPSASRAMRAPLSPGVACAGRHRSHRSARPVCGLSSASCLRRKEGRPTLEDAPFPPEEVLVPLVLLSPLLSRNSRTKLLRSPS